MADAAAMTTCLKTCTLSTEYAAWFPMMAVILLTVLAGIAFVFLVSRMLARREWEAVARAELYHLGIAAIWIVIIAAAATTTCSVACSITGEASPFSAAINYISDVRIGLEDNSIRLVERARNIRINSAINFGLLETMVGPWSGCDSVAGNFETFGIILSPLVGSLIIQQYALILVNNVAFQLLLPLGIILRLIPFLREAGSFIIALSFALYIVLPITYILAEKATAGISYEPAETGAGINCIAPDTALSIFRSVGKSLPQAVFFPALSMIITIAAARTLTKVFKYDFQEIL